MNYSDLIGCKFTVHGRNKEDGFDCYGLAIEVLKRNNIELKDVFYQDLETKLTVHDIAHCQNNLVKLDKLEKLCIIEINVKDSPTHIGIYIGNGQMIHSLQKVGVCIEPISRYSKRIVGYYKVSNS